MTRYLTATIGLLLVSSTPAFAETGAAKPAAPAAPHAMAPAAAPHAAAPAMAPAAAPHAMAPAAAAPVAAAAPKIDWKAMDKKQRKTYMKKTVLPAAQKVFAEFDAKKYKKITCATCHGDGINKDFKMPNPKLPKLPTEPAGFKALGEKKPEAMQFMATKVKPAMAGLLGMEEATQQHPEGFGCYGCHDKDVTAAAPAPAAAPKPAAPAMPAK